MIELGAARRASGIAVLVVLVACSPAQGPATVATATNAPQPTSSPTPSAAVSTDPTPSADRTTITGTLRVDEVEGGCAYLATADGTRYEVRYPEGWEIKTSPLRLLAPDGEVVAGSGDQITVQGRTAREGRSICQIGAIFEAESVTVEQ